MSLIFLDGNTTTSTIEGFEGRIVFPEVMDKQTYKDDPASLREREAKPAGDDSDDDIARVYVTLRDPASGEEQEVPMVFSFSVAEIGFKLARFESFPEGVERLLGPHNPDGRGLPLTFMAPIRRAAGARVSRQFSFRLHNGPITGA